MTFSIFRQWQPAALLHYPLPHARIPEFERSCTDLASQPEQYVLVNPSETKWAIRQSLVSRNVVDGSAVVLRHYSPYHDTKTVVFIHDSGLTVDPSWDENIEPYLYALREGAQFMMLIQSAARPHISSGLVDYLIYRGFRTHGEILVEAPLPFHVLYRPLEDSFAILSGNKLFTYPGFFSA